MTRITEKFAREYIEFVNSELEKLQAAKRLRMGAAYDYYQLYEVEPENTESGATLDHYHSGNPRSIVNGVNIWLTQNGFSQLRNAEPYYDIVRVHKTGTKRAVKRGVSLSIAQLHCSDPRTSTDKYMDVYYKG